jgi:integrase
MRTSTKPEWRKTSTQGLYEYRPAGIAETAVGTYYSRYSVNGKRTFRSLETSVFEHAKIKHAQRNVDVEKDRRRGADLGSDFRTLGALWNEMKRRLDANSVAEKTVVGRRNNMVRLKTHWRRGNFDTFLARSVTTDIVRELRDYLLTDAPWHYHFGRKRRGFKVAVVNQTLWVLRVMLDLAIEKSVIIENPFTVSSVLDGKLTAGGRRRQGRAGKTADRLQIPSRPDMMRILAEMRRVPENSDTFRPNTLQRDYLQSLADELADHAELLAFSGMRRNEARASTVADDCGDEFKIWGTKSQTSERTIPVNPALRLVLDRIKARRIGPKTKLLVTAEPGKALKRACERLGLPKLRNHDLRHFFASACIASGVDIPTVSRWLGHADGGALAMRTYGHLLKDHSQAAAQRLNFAGTDNAAREKSA